MITTQWKRQGYSLNRILYHLLHTACAACKNFCLLFIVCQLSIIIHLGSNFSVASADAETAWQEQVHMPMRWLIQMISTPKKYKENWEAVSFSFTLFFMIISIRPISLVPETAMVRSCDDNLAHTLIWESTGKVQPSATAR
jgi:hypothetical protein